MINFDYPAGATPLEPQEERGLLLTHITTRGELNRWEQDNILAAMDWLEATKPTDILNERFICELHKRMFRRVWAWAGQFRTSDKNIGGSWHQVPMAIRDLCADTGHWIEHKEDPTDLMAVRFHHRLVTIHAFPNGNGRHARLMTDLLLTNGLHQPEFTWGGKVDLSEAGEIRTRYMEALHAADNLVYEPLLQFARS